MIQWMGHFGIWGGSLFQRVGAVNEKARSPYRGFCTWAVN